MLFPLSLLFRLFESNGTSNSWIETSIYPNFEMFLITCEHFELSAACAQAHQQAQVFQNKRSLILSPRGRTCPSLSQLEAQVCQGWAGHAQVYFLLHCHICNTYRKPFPAANACHWTHSHSPAYLHGSSSGVVLWAVPGTAPARVSGCTAVPGGRRRSEQLQQPDFLRSSAPQNCSLRAGRQLRVFWRGEEQWGKMHAVL